MGRPSRAQGVAHGRIGDLRIDALAVAPVVLEVVHAPRRVLRGVHGFEPVRAGPALAGPGAGVGIEAELQALAVDVVRERLHAAGEPLRVGNDTALVVA
jgi:hypothetical protein